MCRTDVSQFYPSVRIDLLREQLLRSGADRAAVARIIETLSTTLSEPVNL
jgi:hypothetical protein